MVAAVVVLGIVAIVAAGAITARHVSATVRRIEADAEARVRGEYATRGAVAWAAHELQPAVDLMRHSERIGIVWVPSEALWLCTLVHRSGDVEARGVTPRAAVDAALVWLRERERLGAPKAGTYRLGKATRERLEADRRETAHADLDEEGLP